MESKYHRKAVRNGWLGQSSTGEIYSRIFLQVASKISGNSSYMHNVGKLTTENTQIRQLF